MSLMNVDVIVKLTCAAASFAFAFLGCVVAWKAIDPAKPCCSPKLLAGNSCAAGVLLAAALVHMLPDATEDLASLGKFPYASTFAGLAFCFLVFIGEVLADIMPKRCEPHTKTACVTYEASLALWPRKVLTAPSDCDEDCFAAPKKEAQGVVDLLSSQTNEVGQPPAPACTKGLIVNESQDKKAGRAASCSSKASRCRVHLHSDGPCAPQVAAQKPSAVTPLAEPLLASDLNDMMEAGTADKLNHLVLQDPASASTAALAQTGLTHNCHGVVPDGGGDVGAEVKSFLLFAALSFHSVMEGLGAGSADARAILPVVGAILAHKGLAAFALGSALMQADLPAWKYWTFVLIFSLGTPVGCIMGMLFVSYSSIATQGIASGICTALASGTFLQVSTMELMPRAFAEDGFKVLCTSSLTLGFVVFSILAIWC